MTDVVAALRAQLGDRVDTDPDLRRAYSDHVPVTVVDGRLLSRWFLDPQRLVEALTAPTEPQRS